MAEPLDYYHLLGLQSRRAHYPLPEREVKQAYRRALLQHHPDKNKQSATQSQVAVDDIALAYKTLSDTSLRHDYDSWLQSIQSDAGKAVRPLHTGLDTVDLDDLSQDAEAGIWSRACRCGDERGFTVSDSELEKHADEGEVIVGCAGCSLWLRVLYGVEE